MIFPIARKSLPAVGFLIELAKFATEHIFEPARRNRRTDMARGHREGELLTKERIELRRIVQNQILVLQNEFIRVEPGTLDVDETREVAVEKINEPFLLRG